MMCSESSVSIYQTMWRHTPEDSNLNLSYYLYMTWWLLAHIHGLFLLNLETSNYSWMFKFWNLSSHRIMLILKRCSFACFSEIDPKTRHDITNLQSVLEFLFSCRSVWWLSSLIASTSFYCRSVWWLPCSLILLHFVVVLYDGYYVYCFYVILF